MPISKPVPAAEWSEPFRLLDLPRELRDRVYRELLPLNKAKGGKQSAALLRVNKQVYLETSAIIYDENVWVMVTFNFRGMASRLLYDSDHTHNITHDTTQHGELPFGREPPAVRVDVHSQNTLRPRMDLFGPWHQPSNAYLPQESAQKYLITPLRYAEPLFRSFTEIFAWQEIENFKFTQVDEIITRSGIYQRRGDRASDLGHFREALIIFHWGLENLLRSEKVLTARSPDIDPANVKKQLLRKKMELVLSYGVLFKREGLGRYSEHLFDWVLEDTADLTENEEANAYYKMGLTCKEQASALKNQPSGGSQYEGDQLNKRAAYAFLQAYALHPEWAIVDHELDMLEDAVGKRKYLQENWSPRINLYSILATFRYKREQLA